MFTQVLKSTRPLGLAIVLATSACGQRGEASAPASTDEPSSRTLAEISKSSHDSWLSLADEPAVHMWWARDFRARGSSAAAADELDKCATLFRWGASHAPSKAERSDFLTTAQEMEASARVLRSASAKGAGDMNRVFERGYRLLAEYHAGVALHEWEAGEHLRAARLLRAAATEIEQGFALSGAPRSTSIDETVADARYVAGRLETSEPPTEHDVRRVIDNLQSAVNELVAVLGSNGG